MVSNAQT
ncbi:hypothetical protein IEO21_08921 [Rhodonia placenta]|nr:hypothetical protein IEO21_11169 [Postia placenta]KAF9796208.1 hypothetical protein IEO21_11021 [Postia placenta]KAF9796681.1 hypothetical protein IEO21_10967 [Postia placenta]KAF9798452.1 hypothetical protein IEO21_10715 [Postia placenta]KAF9801894.1 hypothetical protein IEO21_10015 [Postia placenta]